MAKEQERIILLSCMYCVWKKRYLLTVNNKCTRKCSVAKCQRNKCFSTTFNEFPLFWTELEVDTNQYEQRYRLYAHKNPAKVAIVLSLILSIENGNTISHGMHFMATLATGCDASSNIAKFASCDTRSHTNQPQSLYLLFNLMDS